jgi:hypothetical protein
MKTKIISFSLLLFIITSPTKAQDWEFVGLDSMVIKQLYVAGDTIWAATDARINTNMIAGVFKSTNKGASWFQLDSTLGDGTAVNFYKDSERNLFLLIKGMSGGVNIAGTLYKSSNSGENWTIIQQLENISVDWIGISDFNKNEIYARESHYIVAGWYETVYRSTDGGTDWQEITYLPASSHGRKLTFNLSLTDSNKLYAVVDDMLLDQYFYTSTNKGNSWNYISEPFGVPSELINDRELSERLYTSSFYISEDGGYSWQLANSGLPDTSYYISFYESPLNNKKIYTLRTDGLFQSSKENIYWEKIEGSECLPLSGSYGFIYEDIGELRNVFIDTPSNVIYVGTAKGIYKKNLITEMEDQKNYEPSNFILNQNFPNPFNSSTLFYYYIPVKSFIELKVYDVLGNIITNLFSGEKFSGNYQIEFNAIGLTSGVYLYVLTAITENGLRIREGKKMLLIK